MMMMIMIQCIGRKYNDLSIGCDTNIAIFRWDSPGGVTYEYPAGIQVIPQFVPRKQEVHRYFGSTTEHLFQAVGWILELSPTVITVLYPLWVVHRYHKCPAMILIPNR